jgi:1,4-alpha-glucan branching enzyme
MDPELTTMLLDGIAAARTVGPLRFAAEPGAVIDTRGPARTLLALASNTSIVFGDWAILKVLRRPFDGHHPDLEIPAALAKGGSKLVAAPLGWIELAGKAGAEPTVLAILSEYLPNSADGWTMATASVRTEPGDRAFAEQARLLGQTTAKMHSELATAFGSAVLSRTELTGLADAMAAELDRAIGVVPELAEFQAPIRACYAALAGQSGAVTVQRVHGDLHLAQVLAADGRWVVLDFEGEPSVPLANRRAYAPAQRDVAGMLRSFDYAARHQALEHPDDQQLASTAAQWTRRCQAAFCSGYAEAGGDLGTGGPLIAALTMQKAVYEAVYEASHRRDWLPIPLGALAALTTAKAASHNSIDVTSMSPQQHQSHIDAVADPVSHAEIDQILAGHHHDPHSVLGAHSIPLPDAGAEAEPQHATVIRALRPLAWSAAAILPDGTRCPMRHVHQGVFSVVVPDGVGEYQIAVRYEADGPELVADDPYRHLPTLGEVDLHLIAEGRHEELWRALGARVLPDLGGTSFAVWAPSARGIRVIGDFNHWDGKAHPMRSLGASGVWELFLPGVGSGAAYKFDVCDAGGQWHRKADPMATRTEVPPAWASIVFESGYQWADGDWMAARQRRDALREPMSVYEVHIGSWRPGLSYSQLADELVLYVHERGFTHVEFLPVAEHPYGGSWGYQVTSYYAPSARFGTPDDFRYLVDRLHRAGIGVLVDWVPAHFPKDEWALARFDGTPLYEHADPHRGEHPDWGTLIFDFGRREVRNFLVANALYWLEEFHIDGLRVDAVASMLYLDYSRKAGEWTPNVLGGRENLDAVSFLQEVNATCYKRSAGIVMIAEESTAWPGVTRPVHLGGLGFGLKWNMGWMHDTLAYASHDPLFRHYHHNELTFSMMYAYSENFVLPLSHDEVVHGKGSLLRKMPGDNWKRFATLRALFGYMWAHPGKQLLFMGSEFGQWAEWSEQHGLDWAALGPDPAAGPSELSGAPATVNAHSGLRRLVDDLNSTYRRLPALWREDFSPSGFSWIDANDASGNVISFLRFAPDAATVACVVNFSGGPHHDYRVGLPASGRWREVINSDAEVYGGSGVGNYGAVEAEEVPWHGRPASAVLSLPPLAALWLIAED